MGLGPSRREDVGHPVCFVQARSRLEGVCNILDGLTWFVQSGLGLVDPHDVTMGWSRLKNLFFELGLIFWTMMGLGIFCWANGVYWTFG